MPNNGNRFRHALAEYIRSWGDGLGVVVPVMGDGRRLYRT